MKGEIENAFCAVRPPGHHCRESTNPMGFCFFNNIGVAARMPLQPHGLERVAIIDFDVHHGNGTEDCFAGDEQVLMCSIFQHPFYPYSGTDKPAANMCNVPLAAGCGGEEFRDAVMQVWMPRLREFKPQMIFISAGFDAHLRGRHGRPQVARERITPGVTEELKKLAARNVRDKRIVSMLEGGYVMTSLARSVGAHLRVAG